MNLQVSGPRLNRRQVLRRGAAAAIAAPLVVPAHVLGGNGRTGANDRIHVGVIGAGVRGKYLIGNMPETARVVALCDCSLDQIAATRSPSGVFAGPLARFAAADAKSCSTHQDYRRMLDREKLDAVVISAPDHHHALAAVLACQAGLDVYVEKPLAVTIAEGRAIVNAAKKYDRLVQVGSQHIENWLDCIRTRKTPNAPIETGQRTATVCHLANIARQLGRRLRWDPAAECFLDDDPANALLSRPRREGFELPS